MGDEVFRYDGKRVLVVGGATGMGAAAAKQASSIGAEVIVMDVADVSYPVAQSIKVDLRDQASVDAAIDQIDGPVDAILACAGVADGTRGIMLINFTAQRHLIDRMVGEGKVNTGGAIGFISSVAGLGWMQNLDQVKDFLATPDWEAGAQWVASHEGTDSYSFSKQAINCYVAQQALPMLKKGLRINAILPGPTVTPLAEANADTWLTFGTPYREAAGVSHLQPEEMGNTLLFLCSPAASGINGITVLVDQGHVQASIVDAFNDPIVKMLAGVGDIDPSMFAPQE
jgi:NAD(P)-dependent dehydrogenase (short-subunit alcohol dehydrogenase family)